MYPVYGWKFLSRRAVHSWGANVSLLTKKIEMVVRKQLRQKSEDFYAAGFDALVKRWDKCINVGGGYVEN
jgi:hypothetical protein